MTVLEGSTPLRPDAGAKLWRTKAEHAQRIAHETGSLSSWLWHELKAAGTPVVCLMPDTPDRPINARQQDRSEARLEPDRIDSSTGAAWTCHADFGPGPRISIWAHST